jgi:hypothetical protein
VARSEDSPWQPPRHDGHNACGGNLIMSELFEEDG